MRSLPLVGRVARLLATTRNGEAYAGLDVALDEPTRCSHCRAAIPAWQVMPGGVCRWCSIFDC